MKVGNNLRAGPGTELQQFILERSTSSEIDINTSGTNGGGQVYFATDTGLLQLFFYDGVNWFPILKNSNVETITTQWKFTHATSPFDVTGDGKVTNLNSDRCDDYHAAQNATADTLATRYTDGRLKVSDPVNASDSVSLSYMNAAIAGVSDPKAAVKYCQSEEFAEEYSYASNVLTSDVDGAISIDGVTPAVGDRIALVHETLLLEKYNGIYVVTTIGDGENPWVITRSSDADDLDDPSTEVTNGMQFWVTLGTTNNGSGWLLITPDPIDLNTTPLTFIQNNGTAQIIAGNGIDKTGNVISVIVSGSTDYGENKSIIFANSASTLDGDAVNDTDVYGTLGKVWIGTYGVDNIVGFGHIDHRDSDAWAFAQTATGVTAINSKALTPINFYIGGVNKWSITSTGILQGAGARSISTSTGILTLIPVGKLILSTSADNADIDLSPHGSGTVVIDSTGVGLHVDSGTSTFDGAVTIQCDDNQSFHIDRVGGTSSCYGHIENTNNGLYFGVDSAAGDYTFSGSLPDSACVMSGSTEALHLGVSNTVKVTILNSGHVGIGTVAPDGTLHVHTATAGGVVPDGDSDDFVIENDAAGGMSILTPNNGNANIRFGSPAQSAGALIRWQHTASTFIIASNIVGSSLVLKGDNFITNLTLSGASGSELAVFAKQVGIGTSAPDGTLHVYTGASGAAAAAGDSDDIVIERGAAGGMQILTPYNLNSNIRFGSSASTDGALIRWNHDAEAFTIASNQVGSKVILKGDNFITNLTLYGVAGAQVAKFEGKVGIGIAPTHPLHVSGAILTDAQNVVHATSGLVISQENSTTSQIRCYGPDATTPGTLQIKVSANDGNPDITAILIDNSGNVGINNTSPEKNLDITGTFRTSGVNTLTNIGSGVVQADAGVLSTNNDLPSGTTVDSKTVARFVSVSCVGDTTKEIDVLHNLTNRNPTVTVWEATDDDPPVATEVVVCDVIPTDDNTVALVFSAAKSASEHFIVSFSG